MGSPAKLQTKIHDSSLHTLRETNTHYEIMEQRLEVRQV